MKSKITKQHLEGCGIGMIVTFILFVVTSFI